MSGSAFFLCKGYDFTDGEMYSYFVTHSLNRLVQRAEKELMFRNCRAILIG